MATEPTLGARIMDAAMRWAFDRALCGIEVGRESEDQLRALAARADAAERLAVTADVASAAADTAGHAEHSRLAGEFMEALAAWRAINGEAG